MNHEEFERPQPKPRGSEQAAVSYSPASEAGGENVLTRARENVLLAIDGVEGVGIGRDQIGNDSLIVYVRDRGVATQIPRELDGVAVSVEVTGVVTPLPR